MLFLGAERRPPQDALARFILAGEVDLILKEISQRATERIKALLAVAAFDRAVINGVPKFNVGVERA